jgi:prepilin-type N-terminal cleavage/methylation domain-containing protein
MFMAADRTEMPALTEARSANRRAGGLRRALSIRLGGGVNEAGFSLIELLVASAMSVVLLGAVGSMVVSAMRSQPDLSKKSQNISTARWVLERLTREIRDGIKVDVATPASVSFQTYVRHTTCGGTTPLASESPSIRCEVTYACAPPSCTRKETAPEVLSGGTPVTIFSGIDDQNVFTYSPSAAAPTYVGIRLHIPNPDGPSALTVSDGASMRNAVLTK